MTENLTAVAPACPKTCSACPWRLANQGQPHPHKFYSASNLARLWKGLRSGARMSCHPSDPRMAEFEGYEHLSDRDVTHECTGSLILVQREFMTFQKMGEANPESKTTLSEYKRARPNGLTRDGLLSLMERAVFGGTVLNPIAMSRPDLSDEEVGYPAIGRKRR